MSNHDTNRPDSIHSAPQALDSYSYHQVVGPALQAAAEIAARRGHPTLHDDMPAMLALVEMITRLADLFAEHHPEHAAEPNMLEDAAAGACVMVFRQARMPVDSIEHCLAALAAAYRQIHGQAVVDDARPLIAMAWSHLEGDERDAAQHCLQQACRSVITAIEAWRAGAD